MQKQTAEHGTPATYIIGFILALTLTILAYGSVAYGWMNGAMLFAVIVGLAIVQLVVQLYFFLHVGREPKPRWRSAVFLCMFMVLSIVVGGSLWIMNNLNYNMTSQDMDMFILRDEGIKK